MWILEIVDMCIYCVCFCGACQDPGSGMLILTDEEKRTLIAEGYPVPTRWPLSKQDEKNLKKVQRKIKNKVQTCLLCHKSFLLIFVYEVYNQTFYH